jgi:hypothetical protein
MKEAGKIGAFELSELKEKNTKKVDKMQSYAETVKKMYKPKIS